MRWPIVRNRRLSRRAGDLLVSLGMFLLVGLFPISGPIVYWINVVTVSMYYSLTAMGWNLLAGFTGQYSFAPASFALIGAYTSGLSAEYLGIPPVFGILLGSLTAGLMGLALGRAAFRLRGPYFALTTVAFGQILVYVINNSFEVTRGDLGLSVKPLYTVYDPRLYYYTFLGACVIVQMFLWALVHSRIGLYLQAIREDEVSALARGVDVIYWKTCASAVSATICGLSGALNVHFLQLASPKMGLLMESGLIIMAAVFGGIGTLVGPFLGGLIVKPLAEFARMFNVQHMLILGFAGILIMRFFREGSYGFMALLLDRLRASWSGRTAIASVKGGE